LQNRQEILISWATTSFYKDCTPWNQSRTKSEFYLWATTNVETFLSYICSVKINKINVADYIARDFCDSYLHPSRNTVLSALITTAWWIILQSSWLYRGHNQHPQDRV